MTRTKANKRRQKAKGSKSRTIADDEAPERPTDEKWERMTIYKTFIVSNDDGQNFKFEKEQIAMILPHGFNPEDNHEVESYWVARIKDIRAEMFGDGSHSVWVKVQWYYSAKDVSDVVKSFDPKPIGKYERLYSDHYDFIQPDCFESVIPMYKLNEMDNEQSYIPPNTFYRRYTFEYLLRKVQPKPGLGTCLCHKPYNPNDRDPTSLMHFCPRPSCRKAFHHRCLMAERSKESTTTTTRGTLTVKIPSFSRNTQMENGDSDAIMVTRSARKHAAPPRKPAMKKSRMTRSVADEEEEVARSVLSVSANGKQPNLHQSSSLLSGRALRLLACSPDTDDNVDLQVLIPSTAPMDHDAESDPEPPKKKRRGRYAKKQPLSKTKKPRSPSIGRPPLDTILSSIPTDLLTIATQPLVRGGAFRAGGVAGNIGMVTQARRVVYAALQMGGGDGAVPDDWEDTVFGDDREVIDAGLKNAIVDVGSEDDGADETLQPFVCPNCKSAI